ncbi:MAG TPA: tetratricopeptide repeat protein [Saprospiraceae bacterium]|nr:tetratricopeptide repeat protein [Saprospiraceae bacterium]
MTFSFLTNKLLTFLAIAAWLFSYSIASGQTRPSQQEVNLEKKMIDGKKYQLLGDLDKAETIFKAVINEDVNNTAAYYELSRTQAAKGQLQDALANIRKANRLEPGNEWYLLMEADVHEKITDLYSAMDIYDKLIDLRPDRSHYYELQIGFAKKTNQFERLLNVLNKYEQITGINESVTRTRFETLDAMGRTDDALSAIHRLTEIYPDNIDYKFLAASYCKTKGMDDKAAVYYKDILKIDPMDSRARLAMAGTEKKDGDNTGYLQSIMPIISNPALKVDVKLQEVIPYVLELSEKHDAELGKALVKLTEQLIAVHPADAKSHAIHADVLSILGNKEKAIQSYSKATSLNGNIYVVWEQLIKLLIETYNYDELISQANRAIDIFPNQAYLYYAIGYASYKKKHFDEALDNLNQALIMTGKNIHQRISVYNVLGMVYDELGQADKSVEAFETALSINPKSAETLSQYSLVLSRRIEQSERAVSMAEKVLAEGNQSAVVHQWIAEVFYNQKKYTKAKESIQVALKQGTDGYGYNLAGDILIAMGETDQALDMWQKALNFGYTEQDVKKKISEHKTQ